MGYIFSMPKISLEWGPVQPFLNIGHNFGNICFLKKLQLFLGTKSGSYSSQKCQFHCLAGLIQWARRVYLCPLFALFKTPLTLLTNCAVGECHFRISTQKVTFETWNPSDIWSEWQNDIKQKDKKTTTKKIKPKKRVYYCDVWAVSHSCDISL